MPDSRLLGDGWGSARARPYNLAQNSRTAAGKVGYPHRPESKIPGYVHPSSTSARSGTTGAMRVKRHRGGESTLQRARERERESERARERESERAEGRLNEPSPERDPGGGCTAPNEPPDSRPRGGSRVCRERESERARERESERARERESERARERESERDLERERGEQLQSAPTGTGAMRVDDPITRC
jgi:hypothetical protein